MGGGGAGMKVELGWGGPGMRAVKGEGPMKGDGIGKESVDCI